MASKDDYEIRKLTPRESLRLMDVAEQDIDKILSTVSNTQAYKQAGNSIVVNVMCHMFKNLNIKGTKDIWCRNDQKFNSSSSQEETQKQSGTLY